MILLATGNRIIAPSIARRWPGRVRTLLLDLSPSLVLHTDMPGVDMIVRDVCTENDIPAIMFRTDWESRGVAAATVRNSAMIATLRGFRDGGLDVEIVLFAENHDSADGTRNLIKQAVRTGIPIYGFPLVWPGMKYPLK